MPVRARIVTTWQTDGAERFPKVFSDHPPLSMMDVSEQPVEQIPSDPPLVMVECIWSDAGFAALLADAGYGAGSVMWNESTASTSLFQAPSYATQRG